MALFSFSFSRPGVPFSSPMRYMVLYRFILFFTHTAALFTSSGVQLYALLSSNSASRSFPHRRTPRCRHLLAYRSISPSSAEPPFKQVTNTPEGTLACSFDLASFHRTIPVHPDHKPYLVFQIDGRFYYPHTNSFGMMLASSHAGQVGEPIRQHLEFEGLAPTQRYEDDLQASVTPTPDGRFEKDGLRYAFDPDDALSALTSVNDLQLPWQLKICGTKFSATNVYIGFLWDFGTCCVSLPEAKRTKFIFRLESLLTRIDQGDKLSLKDLQKIHGTLLHASFIYEDGSSCLPPIANAMYGYFRDDEIRHSGSNSLRKTLVWWLKRLRGDSPLRQLYPTCAQQDLGLYVDASTSWGVGIIISASWYAFELADAWKTTEKRGRGICWLEAVALELLFYFLADLGIKNTRLLIHSDNYGAMGALRKGRSSNEAINLCARRTATILSRQLIVADYHYVASADNPADCISHGKLGTVLTRLSRSFPLPADVAKFLKDGHL